MSGLSDLGHYWGNDIALSSTGDLLPVTGTLRGQQRVLRRLLTNPARFDSFGKITAQGDYLWHQNYGAGLPALVGTTLNIPQILGLIRGQMLLEATVAKSPEPQIAVAAITNGVSVNLRYTDAFSNQAVVMSFNVTA